MKKVKLIAGTLLVALSLLGSNCMADGGINFIKNDWKKAIELAKKENKIIFVDVYADWCGPCKSLSNTTFQDELVATFFNENFINLKIDGDDERNDAFLELYPIEAYPTLYFISPKGDVIKMAVGFQDAKELMLLGEVAIDPEKSPIKVIQRKLESGHYSKTDLYDYVLAAYDEDAGYDRQAREFLNSYQPTEMTNDSVFLIFVIADSNIKSAYSQYFAKNYEMFGNLYGEYATNKYLNLIEGHVQKLAEAKNKAGLKEVNEFIKYTSKGEDYDSLVELIEGYYDNLLAEE